MYLVPVEIKKSKIDGRGVFSLQEIGKGTIVWKFDPTHDKVLSLKQFNALNIVDQDELKRVAYLSPTSGRYIYPPENDPARFTNHSPNNNLSVLINKNVSEEPYFFANREIKAGEEITNNYSEFDESIKNYKSEWFI